MLLEIFKKLQFETVMTTCASVCRYWYDVSEIKSLYKEEFVIYGPITSNALLTIILRGAENLVIQCSEIKCENTSEVLLNELNKKNTLRYLDVFNSDQQLLPKILSTSIFLEKLQIYIEGDLPDNDVFKNLIYLKNLKELDLCLPSCTADDIQYLFPYLSQLEMLEFFTNDENTNEMIISSLFATVTTSIRHLTLFWIKGLSYFQLLPLTQRCSAITTLDCCIKYSCLLRTLNLINTALQNILQLKIRIDADEFEMTEDLKISCNRNLKVLDIALLERKDNEEMLANDIILLLKIYPELETLHLPYYREINNQMLYIIPHFPRTLKYLSLCVLSARHIEVIATYCKDLALLNARNFKEESIIPIIKATRILRNLKTLIF